MKKIKVFVKYIQPENFFPSHFLLWNEINGYESTFMNLKCFIDLLLLPSEDYHVLPLVIVVWFVIAVGYLHKK